MLIFGAVWIYLAYDTPDTHPTITEAEKSHIKEQIGKTVAKNHVSKFDNKRYQGRNIFYSFSFKMKKNKTNYLLISIITAKIASEEIGHIGTIFGINVGSLCQHVGNLLHFNKWTQIHQ